MASHQAIAGDATPPPSPDAASATRLTVKVVADTLYLTIDLPTREFAGAGVLADGNKDDKIDAGEVVASRDSLASYLEKKLFIIQDDGMLAPRFRDIIATAPPQGRAVDRITVAMQAPLLNTYERIGFASGYLVEHITGYRTEIRVEWEGAQAGFDVAQSIQWVDPPAEGATILELPGRKPASGAP